MEIFPAEFELGLAEVLQKPGKIVLAGLAVCDQSLAKLVAVDYCPPCPKCASKATLHVRALDKNAQCQDCGELFVDPNYGNAKATNLGQDDLYYLKSILVSTGINLNDDFFANDEVWASRKSPEDKPFNLRHKQDDIIGHITSSIAVGTDGSPISDVIAIADLPDKYHLYTTAVIYKYCDVAARQEQISKLLEEIAEGKWYVSMEAMFTSFDYVLIPQSSTAGEYDLAKARIIERKQDTAFLTKHLRAYGGTGVYNGMKVGRVLRNILFHGKGLVEKPANPESLIFDMQNEPLSGTAAKIMQLSEVVGYEIGELEEGVALATEKETESREFAMELDALKAQVAQLTSQLDKANETIAATKNQNYEKQIAELKAELDAAQAAVEEATKKFEAEAKARNDDQVVAKKSEETIAALEKAKAEAEKAKADAEAELAKIAAEKKTAERIAKVKAAFGFEKDEQAQEALEAGLADLSDEKFEKTLALQVKIGESKVSNKPAPMGGGSKPVKAAEAASDGLNETQDSTDTDLAVGGDTEIDGLKETQAEILAWFNDGSNDKQSSNDEE